jgi:hypothetical protein
MVKFFKKLLNLKQKIENIYLLDYLTRQKILIFIIASYDDP